MLNSQTQNVFLPACTFEVIIVYDCGKAASTHCFHKLYIYNWKVKLDDKAHACSKWKPNSNESATEISFLALLTVEVWNSNQPSRKPASFLAPLKGSVFWKAPGWSSSRIAEVADRPNPTARWVHGRSGDRAVASDGRRSWHSWVPGCQRGLKEVWLLVAGWSFKWNLYKTVDICAKCQKEYIYGFAAFGILCMMCIKPNDQSKPEMGKWDMPHFRFVDVGFTCSVGYWYSVHSLKTKVIRVSNYFSQHSCMCACVCPIEISWGRDFHTWNASCERTSLCSFNLWHFTNLGHKNVAIIFS